LSLGFSPTYADQNFPKVADLCLKETITMALTTDATNAGMKKYHSLIPRLVESCV
jgi:hypothetical protein